MLLAIFLNFYKIIHHKTKTLHLALINFIKIYDFVVNIASLI